jgi:hypothetical protein
MDVLAQLMRPRVAIRARKVEEEVISVERYLKLTPEERADMASYEVVPPTIGGNGFGGFRVRWKTPKFRV